MKTEEIGSKIASGAAWMALFKLVERSLGLISVVILARLLTPEDFGVVAMAMALIAMLDLLGAFSFDIALIQNQKASRHHFDTAWTFNVVIGLVIAALLLALAGPAAGFYREDRLTDVIMFLAIGSLLQGLENIGVVEFRKQLHFRKEFIFLFTKKLVGFCVTVPLAVAWENYWALVVGQVSSKVAGVVLSYGLHSFRPRLSISAGKELFGFSGWLMANNLLFYLKNRSVELIIGRMLGPRSLGLFSIAYEISNLPTTELIGPMNRAIFPGYAKLTEDKARLRSGFLNIIGLIAVVALPVGAGVAVMSEYVVQLLLGDQWLDAIPLVSVLAIFGTLGALQSNTTYIFLALGKPQIETYLGVAYVIILLTLLAVLIPNYKTFGVALAYLTTVVLMMPPTLLLIRAQLGLEWGMIAGAFWRPLVATTGMYFGVDQWLNYLKVNWQDAGILVELASGIVLGATLYLGLMLIFWLLVGKPESSAEKTIIRFLKNRLSRRASDAE